MRRILAVLALAGGAALSGGCYHATIETGATPSPTVVEEQWAASWVYGLVPPKTVNVASQCQNGVARVETQHSFLNMLVGGLTFGIFEPMSIKVTCADRKMGAVTSGVVEHVAATASAEVYQGAITRAADVAAATGSTTFVMIDR